MGTEKPGGKPKQQTLATGRRWSFGSTVLDERSLELFVDGVPVKIARKPLEVLIYLVQHAGEVVTKDELFEHVWDRRIFDDGVLTKSISTLRQALGDNGPTAIATVRGYGYRLVADLKVESAAQPATVAFDFEPGSHPPLRPHWSLVERLGGGGLGEAWLARHDKTHEQRVFKFARTGTALASFKRETALYRVIAGTPGARTAVARIFDWNLDQEPYFLEVEYVEGRDLESWAEAHGGLAQIPLETRLDLAAQIAEITAATHSVGVLHKDLKPGNVLIQVIGDDPSVRARPRAKLCDFGSGGILDPDRLRELGITRHGIAATDRSAGGTALYMAPEVLAGKPATVQSDIYALGVILYQLVVGSFKKPLAPGWDTEVDDELLREDIALAAAGSAERRLTDAATLAELIKTLDTRHVARREQITARERSERMRETLRKLRLARASIAALLLLAFAALAGGVIAYKARNQALEATATTQAINAFLTDDVLGVDPAVEQPSQASYQSLLDRAGAQIDKRFADQPAAAARLHLILGRRYQEIGQLDSAESQYQQAVTLQGELGEESDQSLLASERLANLYFGLGRIQDSLNTMAGLVARCSRSHGPKDLATLVLRARVARLSMLAGQYQAAEKELRQLSGEVASASPAGPETMALFKEWLGIALVNDISTVRDDRTMAELLHAQIDGTLAVLLLEYTGDFAEAESLYRKAISTYSRTIGDEGELIASHRLELSEALAYQQRFVEAEETLALATRFFDKWLPPRHWLRAAPLDHLAALRMDQRRPGEAVALATAASAFCDPNSCTSLYAEEIRYDLGVALSEAGRAQEAIGTIGDSLKAYERMFGKDSLGTLRRRISLTGCLLTSGRAGEAAAEFAQISDAALAALPRTRHLVLGEYRRVEGLLAIHEGRPEPGVTALTDALAIFQERLGPSHWRSKRLAQELNAARAGLPKPAAT